MSAEDIEASKAPLMDHLIELRSRLIKALLGFGIAFIGIIADRLIGAWARRRKQDLGLT